MVDNLADETTASETTPASVRAESDTFVAQLERLHELETAKRELAPTDPRFLALAVQVEDAAKALLEDARGQTELGDRAHASGMDVPIKQVPPDLSATEILAAWRDLERRVLALDPASDEAGEMRMMIDAYRRAYQSAFDEVRRLEKQPF
jgi:hypothetical protein